MIEQAGAVPWRLRKKRLEVLLITNSSGTRWIVPKGNVELSERPEQCAVKEAFEEAGVEGRLHPAALGEWVDRKNGMDHSVILFPLQVTQEHEDFPERGMRTLRWELLEDALSRLNDARLCALLRTLPDFLAAKGVSLRGR